MTGMVVRDNMDALFSSEDHEINSRCPYLTLYSTNVSFRALTSPMKDRLLFSNPSAVFFFIKMTAPSSFSASSIDSISLIGLLR